MQLSLAPRRWKVAGLDAGRLDHQHALEGFTTNIMSEHVPTKEMLLAALSDHVKQPSYKRNPGHSVVAIYLGWDEWCSLLDDRTIKGHIAPRDNGEITFSGVPVYRVTEKSHVRIVSEFKEP